MNARALLAEVLRRNVVISSVDTPLSDVEGWDSLKGVRLILRLEEIVGRELSEGDIESIQSVADVDRVLSLGMKVHGGA
jgi:acyl carrier protein